MSFLGVAPVRERGLKFINVNTTCDKVNVAPVRERGLKLYLAPLIVTKPSRSREGAWIEITPERSNIIHDYVAPVRERGLKYLQ